MRDILKNSGKEQTFHGESVAREHGKVVGRRFFDLIEVDIAEKSLRAAIVVGINYNGPNLANISREHERLLMEQAEKEKEDMQFELAMKHACQMMQMRNSTTAKPAIVEEKVATAEGSMTNRIMFTEVMVAEEEQDMAGNNMDFYKSCDETTRLVSDDNTGVLESEQRAQDIRKEDLKRAAMQERKRREKNARVLRCNSEELKVLALRQRRNRRDNAHLDGCVELVAQWNVCNHVDPSSNTYLSVLRITSLHV